MYLKLKYYINIPLNIDTGHLWALSSNKCFMFLINKLFSNWDLTVNPHAASLSLIAWFSDGKALFSRKFKFSSLIVSLLTSLLCEIAFFLVWAALLETTTIPIWPGNGNSTGLLNCLANSDQLFSDQIFNS